MTVVALAGALLAAPHAGAQDRPIVIAHRGGAAVMSENTLPAFDYAIRVGAQMLEFDMQMTRDGQIVITHDTRVNSEFCRPRASTNAQSGYVREMTLAELRQFDCGSARRAIYPGQALAPGAAMPTLDEVLTRYRGGGVRFFGEIKMPRDGEGVVDPVEVTKKVESIVQRHGVVDRFVMQSFDWRTIDAMHRINPKIRTCLLGAHKTPGGYLAAARRHNAGCVVVRIPDASAEQVRELRSAGLMVVSEVIDDDSAWDSYLRLGVDAIFTNHPAAALKFLNDSTPRHD